MRCFLRKMTIPANAWAITGTKYNTEPEAKKMLEQATLEAEERLYKPDMTKDLLDREKVIQVVRTMEIDKTKLSNRMAYSVKMGKIAGSNVNFALEVTKM